MLRLKHENFIKARDYIFAQGMFGEENLIGLINGFFYKEAPCMDICILLSRFERVNGQKMVKNRKNT